MPSISGVRDLFIGVTGGDFAPAVTFAATRNLSINATGNLGGFVAQNVVPLIKQKTGNDLTPMLFLAGCLAFAGIMVFVVQGLLGRSARAAVPAE